MVITLSPAKTLDFNGECLTNKHSNPEFISDSKALVNGLKKITQKELGELMSISEKLSKLNFDRYVLGLRHLILKILGFFIGL